jgi:hypothetical protein
MNKDALESASRHRHNARLPFIATREIQDFVATLEI